jgi:hypothetical protein
MSNKVDINLNTYCGEFNNICNVPYVFLVCRHATFSQVGHTETLFLYVYIKTQWFCSLSLFHCNFLLSSKNIPQLPPCHLGNVSITFYHCYVKGCPLVLSTSIYKQHLRQETHVLQQLLFLFILNIHCAWYETRHLLAYFEVL